MLILLITIIFCHYLIRLCMLTMRPKGPSYNDEILNQSQIGSVARPREPIRIILARDEELGLHGDMGSVEEDKEIMVPPPPPPAYGVWRCSVRADPNLIHWQRTEHVAIEEAPTLNRSESTRPPSYRTHHDFDNTDEVREPQQALVRIQRDSWESYAQHMGAEPQRHA